jgi:hypothetical protein
MENTEDINSETSSFASKNKIDFSLFGEYYEKEFRKIYESNDTYKGEWNWAAFSLCGIWLLWKGLWKHAVILIVSAVIIRVMLGVTIELLLMVVCYILLGYRGTWLLYNVKVQKIEFPKSF